VALPNPQRGEAWPALQERNGSFRLIFRYHGKQHTFTIGHVPEDEGQATAATVGRLIRGVEEQRIRIPAGLDVVAFVRQRLATLDRETDDTPEPVPQPRNQTTLGILRDRYVATHSNGTIEANSLDTVRLHFSHFDRGRILVMIDREDYWQCGFVIPKGALEDIRRRGLESFRAEIAAIAPFVQDRVGELRDWDDVKLLTVVVDRLRRWYRPGLLCIGDAAHAMSPVGGVGINLAVQDAVAAANLLADKLREGRVTVRDLRDVQRRREPPTRLTQRVQVFIQDRIISRALGARRQLGLPLPLRLLRWFPVLRRIPARLIGIGLRPEHVRSPVEQRADALAGMHP
jgi:hypothetical protein